MMLRRLVGFLNGVLRSILLGSFYGDDAVDLAYFNGTDWRQER